MGFARRSWWRIADAYVLRRHANVLWHIWQSCRAAESCSPFCECIRANFDFKESKMIVSSTLLNAIAAGAMALFAAGAAFGQQPAKTRSRSAAWRSHSTNGTPAWPTAAVTTTAATTADMAAAVCRPQASSSRQLKPISRGFRVWHRSPTPMVRVASTARGRNRSLPMRQTHSGCTKFMATAGNGPRIAITSATPRILRPTARHGSKSDCTKRMVRGGPWSWSANMLRSGYRYGVYAGSGHGFRVVRTLNTAP